MPDLQWINVEQGTDEWHALRRTKRPASMSSWVTGTSKYNGIEDAYKLIKLGEKAEVSTWQQRIYDHGHRLEPEARSVLEVELGVSGEPRVGVRGEYLASFDFVSNDIFVDIKCPYSGFKSETWKLALEGKIEPQYADQLEHQGYVYGRDKKAALFVYIDDAHHALVPYTLNDSRWSEIHAAWEEFFALYINGDNKPGPVRMETDAWAALAKKYVSISEKIQKLDAEKRAVIEEMAKLSGGRSASGAGVTLVRERRGGVIDYKAACAELLTGVDLERFRGEPGEPYFRVVKARGGNG